MEPSASHMSYADALKASKDVHLSQTQGKAIAIELSMAKVRCLFNFKIALCTSLSKLTTLHMVSLISDSFI